MSLNITLSNPRTGHIVEMNWLRNPHGLCNWAEDMWLFAGKQQPEKERTLWYVINHWAYDESDKVDRRLFIDVVRTYGDVIMALEEGYFFFNIYGVLQTIAPNWNVFPRERMFYTESIVGRVWLKCAEGDDKIGIPIEHFAAPVFHLNRPTLEKYKAWYQELIDFAELLQDTEYEFYCSN